MTETSAPKKRRSAKAATPAARLAGQIRSARRWILRGVALFAVLFLCWILLLRVINVPAGIYMRQESARLGGIQHEWVDWEDIAPVMARSVVAAEDANYCLHWGFDMAAIRDALDSGGRRGASTISQQVVKNVFLWHGRDWLRKALEAGLTPIVETLWSKERILEVYLNVAEFDEGVFGVAAAAKHYFKTTPNKLTATQAARLAMVLPNPKAYSASRPSDFQRRRSARILDGAQTIAADGRAACFERASG